MMINGNYSLAIGCLSQLASSYKENILRIKGFMDLWN
jgi:hypothetical protein